MSGPKITVYSLTGRAREIVIGQIRCEQQSIACRAQTMEMIREMRQNLVKLNQQMQNAELMNRRVSDRTEQIRQMQFLQKEAAAEAAEIMKELTDAPSRASVKYQITEEAYAEKQEELKRVQALLKRAEALKAKTDGGSGSAQADTGPDPHGSLSKKTEDLREIQASILEDLSGICSFDLEEQTPDMFLQDQKDSIREALDRQTEDDVLPKDMRDEIRTALIAVRKVPDLPHLKTFQALTVRPLLRRAEAYRQEVQQGRAEFDRLTARYEALCQMAGEKSGQFPYSADAAARMQAEAERLESLIARQKEQAYISSCIDEVMAEMGYDLIGTRDVQKKNGKQLRHELYTFSEGTAVDVTFASDGQIAMELGGLAGEDRIPDAEETGVLVQEMDNFCGKFAEFERRMLERGITVGDRIVLSPPAAEYASLINVNDFEVTGSAGTLLRNVLPKRRKQTGKKQMRKGE